MTSSKNKALPNVYLSVQSSILFWKWHILVRFSEVTVLSPNKKKKELFFNCTKHFLNSYSDDANDINENVRKWRNIKTNE